jgi:hypothetical protein
MKVDEAANAPGVPASVGVEVPSVPQATETASAAMSQERMRIDE